jgi:threonylcarbamoyladenosine tRNA methylthiotransferase CDKAL1
MTSIFVETFGCALNQSESEDLEHQLVHHHIVESTRDAEIIVLNTCAVVEATEKKVLKRIQALYGQRNDRKLIVTGCLAELRQGWLHAAFPGVFVIPTEKVASFINARYASEPTTAQKYDVTANVKIAHGCRGNCTYCVVRIIKGALTSRGIEEVVDDVLERIQKGAKQVFLTAQDAGAYGLDCGQRLPYLIQAVCDLEQDFMLRIGMMNVSSITDIVEDLVRVYAHPKVYKFLHVPVQSGSDSVLKAMGREHTVSDFTRVVNQFRETYRDLTISTDFIVGFPTETDDDFRATVQLLREVRPLKVNITRFSPRKGTSAFNLKPLGGGKVKERSRVLTAEHHRTAAQQNCESVGRIYRTLAVEHGKNGSTICYNNFYRPIVILRELSLGLAYTVRVTGATPTYLIGTLS